MSSVDDGENKFMFAYGVFGNEMKQVQKLSGLNRPVEFNYETDITGFKTESALLLGGEEDYRTIYKYNPLGKTVSISQQNNHSPLKVVQLAYDGFGQIESQLRFQDGKPVVATKNTYDSLGRIMNIAHSSGEKVLADYHYTWDAANRITDINFGTQKTSQFGYDKTSQLIAAKYDFMNNESYRYDFNGNRLNAEIQGQKQSYKTGDFNRLLSDNENSYEYDPEGNRISKGNTKYEWDNRNRLIKAQTPAETVEYVYDYQNRLVKRTVDKDVTVFIHDGWHIVRQLENGKPTHRYLWGTKQDELLCDNDSWTLGDHLNTIRDVVKSNGNVIAHYDYNAFGKRLPPAQDSLSFAYTGKLTDAITELQWNINRWYDANIGSWLSSDPIGFHSNDANLYRYVQNMSMMNKDPNGFITDNDAQRIINHWIVAPEGSTLCADGYIRNKLYQKHKGKYYENLHFVFSNFCIIMSYSFGSDGDTTGDPHC
jgi:RHS repeat-associated protein